jgi:hypothetical protein
MKSRAERAVLCFAACVILATVCSGVYWSGSGKPNLVTNTLEESLWVCDWEVTKIYAPGSKEQASVVRQLRTLGLPELAFDRPVLYRMGGSTFQNPSEGILMIPFDPRHPEIARALIASSRH